MIGELGGDQSKRKKLEEEFGGELVKLKKKIQKEREKVYKIFVTKNRLLARIAMRIA